MVKLYKIRALFIFLGITFFLTEEPTMAQNPEYAETLQKVDWFRKPYTRISSRNNKCRGSNYDAGKAVIAYKSLIIVFHYHQ